MTDNRGTNETPHTPSPSPSPEDVRDLIREGRDTADRMDAAEERYPYPGQVGHATMVRRLTDALESAERERDADVEPPPSWQVESQAVGGPQDPTCGHVHPSECCFRVQELERSRDEWRATAERGVDLAQRGTERVEKLVRERDAEAKGCEQALDDALNWEGEYREQRKRAERAEAALRKIDYYQPPADLRGDLALYMNIAGTCKRLARSALDNFATGEAPDGVQDEVGGK